jgi:hypothetical protein
VALQRHELGSDTSQRLVSMTVRGGIAVVLLGVLVAQMSIQRPLAVVSVLTATGLLIFMWLCVRWPFRDRWAGRLLLDAGRPRPLWVRAMPVLSLLALVARVSAGKLDVLELASTLNLVAFSLHIYFSYTRNEIRERGIVAFGQFFPWHCIVARRWDDGDRYAILRLRSVGVRRFLPEMAVIMPREKKDAADALLQRYLSEWPRR